MQIKTTLEIYGNHTLAGHNKKSLKKSRQERWVLVEDVIDELQNISEQKDISRAISRSQASLILGDTKIDDIPIKNIQENLKILKEETIRVEVPSIKRPFQFYTRRGIKADAEMCDAYGVFFLPSLDLSLLLLHTTEDERKEFLRSLRIEERKHWHFEK